MTPGGGKRKRGDRTYSYDSVDGSGRPSPHRPGNLGLAHPGSQSYQNARNRPRNNNPRGGRGGFHPPASPVSGSYSQATKSSPISSPTMTTVQNQPIPHPNVVAPVSKPPVPEDPPVPYAYEHLTEEMVKDWKSTGRSTFLSIALQAAAQKDYMVLSSVFQELINAGMYGKIDAIEAGELVRDTRAGTLDEASFDCASVFLDTLSVVTEHKTMNPQLLSIVVATEIPEALMRETLEEPLLKSLGLIRDTFAKMFIRKQTNVLYRQANYNLLREETEGYSKLVTELFTTTANGPPLADLVEDAFENIKALIGAFDLDAGRVLDVTLDVFASILVKNYRFFVKLLRCSSWWPQDHIDNLSAHQVLGGLPIWAHPGQASWMPSDEDKNKIASLREARDVAFWERAKRDGIAAFFSLGGRQIAITENDDKALEPVAESDAAAIQETNLWIKITGTKPPLGNSVAAQLLGFKLRFYSSNARDAQDKLPPNLIYLSALLIKIGFISLKDLYTHLYPPDDAMESIRAKQRKEKAERERLKRPGGGSNALANAGALVDDTLPAPPPASISRVRDADTRSGTPARGEQPSSTVGTPSERIEEQPEKVQLPEPSDQKIELLRSLLCIGALPEALYLLGRYPWLPDAFPDLPEYIHRILHHCLSKIYQPVCPLSERESLRCAARTPTHDQSGLPKGDIRVTTMPPPKILRWAKPDVNNSTDGCDYRFYWDDWNDNIPVCQSIDDVFTLCNTLVNYSGVKIGQDAKLLIKLVRIGRHSLAQDSSASNLQRWIDLSRRLLVPALSLTRANPDAVTEVFDLLKRFPTEIRFSLYAEWYEGATSRSPDIMDAFTLAKIETKDTLRRISKTNTKQMARALAKVACASPGVVFATALSQIEAYDNFIEVIVECGRYFTYMGYDVLTWSIMNALGRAGRDRISGDGISTSGWLIALAKFVGKVYRRYAHMNPLPILQYVLEQVRQNNFTDLRILRELISNMAGIAADTNFSDAQVQAMAGGELLQSQTLLQLQDTRHDNKASAKRLMKCITDNGLTNQLLISIAQERQMCIFNPAQDSLKVISENFDDINVVLTQYLELLRTNLSTKDFVDSLPNIASLVIDFGLDPSIAFTIHRMGISRAIAAYDAALKEEEAEKPRKLSQEVSEVNGDIQMLDSPTANDIAQSFSEGPGDEGPINSNAEFSVEGEPITVASNGVSSPKDSPSANRTPEPWHPVLQNLMEELRATLGDDFEQSMSLRFFVTFWQLSLQDLSAPSSSYNDEIEKQKKSIAQINADRSDISVTGVAKKENEKKRINDLLERLKEEMKSHIYSYSHVRGRLMKEKDHWFVRFAGRPHALNASLLQECFLPRLLLSPLDSFFTFRMLFFLHGAGTPGFSTMHFLDRLLDEKSLTAIIFQCTARESENLGRFLYEVLKELSLWHAKQSEYEKKAFGKDKLLPGFARSVHDGKPTNLLEFEDFRRILRKWHINLNNVLKTCLSGDEYMHIKNAITILKCIQKVFPAMNFVGNQLCEVIYNLIKAEKDSRQDIWVAANSLYGSLKSREKHWVLPQAFYTSETPQGQTTSSRQVSIQTKSSRPNGTAKLLNASAAEFQPKPSSSVNGTSDPPKSGRSEVEDGELNDSEMTDAILSSEIPPNGAEESIGLNKGGASLSELNSDRQPAPDSGLHPDSQSSHQKPAMPSSSLKDATPPSARRSGQNTSTTRSETGRSGTTPTPSNRPQHDLPSRPDPPRSLRSRYAERPDSISRPTEHGRLDRPGDLMQQRQRDQQSHPAARFETLSNERRRDGGLHDSRDDRDNSIDSRQPRPDSRTSRYSSRETDLGRRPQEGPARRDGRETGFAAATESSARHSLHAATSSPKPSRPDGTMLNPERAAIIGQNPDNVRDDHSRPPPSQNSRDFVSSGRQTPGDGNRPTRPPGSIEPIPRSSRSSRPSSLDRGERLQQNPREEERRDDRIGEDYRRSGRDRNDTRIESTPLGPRSGRSLRSSNNDSSRYSDSMQPPLATHNTSDYSHSRLGSEYARPARHQESTYGRLNQESGSPPSPQRASASVGRNNTSREAPSQSRPPLGSGGHQNSNPPRDSDVPSTRPAASSSTSGSTNVIAEASSSGLAGIHPDRLNNIEGPPTSKPPPLQMPPSGPRSSQSRNADAPASTSMIPSPTSRNPPTGPSGSNSDRRHGTRQIHSLQTHLAQGSTMNSNVSSSPAADTSIRIQGRATQARGANSASNTNADPPVSARFPGSSNDNGVPLMQPRSEHLSTREAEYGRRDGAQLRENRNVDRDRDRERDGERSYRSSRNTSPERNPQPRSNHNPSDKPLRTNPGDRGDYGDTNFSRSSGDREHNRGRERREEDYAPVDSRYPHGSSRGPPPMDPTNGPGGRWANDRGPPRRGQMAPRGDDRKDMTTRKRNWGGEMENTGSAQQGESKRPRRPL